jgi:uncharacterized surface protein with fasciclin (FAS1) repeats
MIRFVVASVLVASVVALAFSVQAGDGRSACSKGACPIAASSAEGCPASQGCPIAAKACSASKSSTCGGCPVAAAAQSCPAAAQSCSADKCCTADKSCQAKKPKDIVDTAAGAKNFKTLVKAVKAAGLVETLKGDGPFTVFAPTDKAFAKLPEGTLESLLKPENKEKLAAILTYHVVPGKVTAADVVKLKNAKTVQGSNFNIRVKDGKVKVDDAKVVKTDIEAKNGVIHVIDAVILPN